MREWIDNGAQLAWLIDPERKAVEIYRPGQEPEIHAGIDQIAGEPPLKGFELDLRPVWDPLGFDDPVGIREPPASADYGIP